MSSQDARFEIAHLATAELLTPDLEGSLWFFTTLLGMRETGRSNGSVYLRCYEDPYSHSLKLTESDKPGIGGLRWRTTSEDALNRRAAALSKAGLGKGWTAGDLGVGKTFAFDTPDGHAMELVWDIEKHKATGAERSPILNRRSKRPLQGLPPKRLDHVNIMASNVREQRQILEQTLGFGTREQVVSGDDEFGAWMSVNILGHELAIMKDQTGAKARLHHLAFYFGIPQHNTDFAEICREYGIQIEAGPDVHGVTQGAFLYVLEPGGNRIELFGNAGILQLEPDWEPVVWDLEEFATGAGLAVGGTVMPQEFLLYGTPAVTGQEAMFRQQARDSNYDFRAIKVP
ncbi:VOC family protein [Pseudarthrobacter sp. S9]|uniref:VOC family protein n=1 Tax=Pseudarthrobacter sp. S9 TaxID=3418421 RepID=UPI003D03EB8D